MISKHYVRKYTRIIPTITAGLWLLIGVVPGASYAEDVQGTDLIYLIDQSGSMSGSGAARVVNDEMQKRVATLKSLAGALEVSAMKGNTNRIAVIEFGGRNAKNEFFKPSITLDSFVIPPRPISGEITIIQQLINNGLNMIKPAFRGDTDHAMALQLAVEQAQRFIASPPAAMPGYQPGHRNIIVVMITDGAPYATGTNISQLVKEIKQNVTVLNKINGLSFLVFGFNDKASHYWKNKWGQFWTDLATKDPRTNQGHAYLLTQPENYSEDPMLKISALVTEFLNPEQQAASGKTSAPSVTETSYTEDSYIAPPFLKALKLSIGFSKKGLDINKINIITPSGDRLLSSMIKADESGTFASVTISYPQPGRWRFRTQDSEYHVKATPIYEQVTLLSPKLTVAQYVTLPFEYQLSDGIVQQLLNPSAGLAGIKFNLMVTDPTKATQSFILTINEKNGVLQSAENYQFKSTGKYQLALIGKIKNNDGDVTTVFSDNKEIQVNTLLPVELQLALTPPTVQPITLTNGKAMVAVTASFIHAYENTNVDPQQVLMPTKHMSIFARPEMPNEDFIPQAPETVDFTVEGDHLTAQVPLNFVTDGLQGLAAVKEFRFVINSPDGVIQQNVSYLGLAGRGDYNLSTIYTAKQSYFSVFKAIWIYLVVASAIVLVLLAIGWFYVFRGSFKNSDKERKRAPRLSYVPKGNQMNIVTWSLAGRRVNSEAKTIILPNGDSWNLNDIKITRKRTRDSAVQVTIRYRVYDKKINKRKQYVLKAIDDHASAEARVKIQGIGDQEAEFILYVGNL